MAYAYQPQVTNYSMKCFLVVILLAGAICWLASCSYYSRAEPKLSAIKHEPHRQNILISICWCLFVVWGLHRWKDTQVGPLSLGRKYAEIDTLFVTHWLPWGPIFSPNWTCRRWWIPSQDNYTFCVLDIISTLLKFVILQGTFFRKTKLPQSANMIAAFYPPCVFTNTM